MKCDRCGKETLRLRMSRFCTERCCEECIDRERKHPDYKKAVEAERNAVISGNMNFPGIGRPSDL